MTHGQQDEASESIRRDPVREAPPITSVAVGVDGSEGAQRALDWAGGEADRNGASLLIIGACLHGRLGIESPGERTMTQILEGAVEQVALGHPRMDVQHRLFPGLGAEALIDASHNADLVVVGSRGWGGFRSLLLGSVGQHCVTHARCTVAVVRHEGDSADQEWVNPRQIVVGIDGSSPSTEALSWAVAEGKRTGAALHLLGAFMFPSPSESAYLGVATSFPDAARDAVEHAREEVHRLAEHVAVDGAVSADAPGPALVRASKDADLVVVGARGLGSFRGLLLGSVSQYLAHHSHCPIVVVRDRTSG